MESLKIEATKSTPEINFELNSGLLEIKGLSKTSNAPEFYQPLMEALEQYANNPAPNTTVKLFLNYFSTSSSKCLLGILKELKKIDERSTNVKVNWYYEENDEEMLDSISDYETLIDLDFKFIAIPEGSNI